MLSLFHVESARFAGHAMKCLALAVFAVGFVGAANAQEADPNSAEVEFVEPRTTDTLVARTDLGPITIGDVQQYYKHYQVPVEPKVEPEKVPSMPDRWVDVVARSLAISRAFEREVEELPAEEQREYERRFDQYLLNYVFPEVEKELKKGLVEPTEEEIRAYYERHKPEYFTPFQFSMRHIFLSTYKPYQVQAGDTLESIAREVGGSAELIDEIRADVEGKPLRWVPENERHKRLFKPLAIGERLLIPMNEKEAEAVRQKLVDILSQLDEGKDFAELAQEYSEANVKGEVLGPLPTGIQEMVPELLEAARETPVGEVSEPFRTKHGWMAIQVVERTDEQYKPLAEVRDEIRQTLIEKRQAELDRALTDKMFAYPEVEIHYDLFAKAPDLPDDAVVAEFGERRILWADFKKHFKRQPVEDPTREQIEFLVRSYPPAQFAAMLLWADKTGLFEKPELNRTYHALRTWVFASEYTKQYIAERVEETLTEEMIESFYEENKEEHFYYPARVSYRIIERKLEDADALSESKRGRELEKMRRELQKELEKKVASLDDFLVLAEFISPGPQDPNARNPFEVKGMPVHALSGRTGEALKGLEVGQWSDAFIEGDAVRAVALTDRTEKRPLSLSDARDKIEEILRKEIERRLMPHLEQEWLEKVNYEPVLAGSEG